jgi:hypothetical protein
MKYVRVPTQAYLLNCHLFTFNTRLIIHGCTEPTDTFHTIMWQEVSVGSPPTFVYYVYASALFIQYYIIVLATFRLYIHIIWKYWTIDIMGHPLPFQCVHKEGLQYTFPDRTTVSHPTSDYIFCRHNYTVLHHTTDYIFHRHNYSVTSHH